MRRVLLSGLIAASLGLPALALAAPNALRAPEGPVPPNGRDARNRGPIQPQPANPESASLGAGMFGGSEPGHVDSPGVTKIDPESRGPINDVQPGRGTDDTPQSANPPPAR